MQTDLERKETTAVDKAQDAAAQAKDKAGEAAGAAMEQAKRAAAQVGEQAKSTVDTRRTEVAHELGNVAEVVRQTAQDVGMGNSDTVARYGERIADQIEGVSTYLDEHGVEDILTDIQDFARRQPALFLGGAFMLGIVVGRFLRSSGSRLSDYGYGSGGYDRYSSDYSGGSYTSSGSMGTSSDRWGGAAGGQIDRRGTTTGSTGTGGGASRSSGGYTGAGGYTGSAGSTGSGTTGDPRGSTGAGTQGTASQRGNAGPTGSTGSSTGQPRITESTEARRNQYQTGVNQESTTLQDDEE
jgi:hypothetical protein